MKPNIYLRAILISILLNSPAVKLYAQYRHLEKTISFINSNQFEDAKVQISKIDTSDYDSKIFYYRASALYFVHFNCPEYNPIAAFKFNQDALKLISRMERKDIEKLCNNKSICNNQIDIEIKREAKLVVSYIKRKQDLSLKNIGLKLLQSLPEYHEVLNWSDSLELSIAQNSGTRISLKVFLEEHPNSNYRKLCLKYLEDFDFNETKKINTESAFRDFALLYPNSVRIDFINFKMDSASFTNAQSINSLEAYHEHIIKYPKGPNSTLTNSIIEELTFQKIKKEKTIESLDDFLLEFPESKYNLTVSLIKDSLIVHQKINENDIAFLKDRCKTKTEPGQLSCEDVKNEYCRLFRKENINENDTLLTNFLIDNLNDCEWVTQIKKNILDNKFNKILNGSDASILYSSLSVETDSLKIKQLENRINELRAIDKIFDLKIQKIELLNAIKNKNRVSLNNFLKKYPSSIYHHFAKVMERNFVCEKYNFPTKKGKSLEELSNMYHEYIMKSKVLSNLYNSDTLLLKTICNWTSILDKTVEYNSANLQSDIYYFDGNLPSETINSIDKELTYGFKIKTKYGYFTNGIAIFDIESGKLNNDVTGYSGSYLFDAVEQKPLLQGFESIQKSSHPHCYIVNYPNNVQRIYNSYYRKFITGDLTGVSEERFIDFGDHSYEKQLFAWMGYPTEYLMPGFSYYDAKNKERYIIDGTGNKLLEKDDLLRFIAKGTIQAVNEDCYKEAIAFKASYVVPDRQYYFKLIDPSFQELIYPSPLLGVSSVDFFGRFLLNTLDNKSIIYDSETKKTIFSTPAMGKGDATISAYMLPLKGDNIKCPIENLNSAYDRDKVKFQTFHDLCQNDYSQVHRLSNTLLEGANVVYDISERHENQNGKFLYRKEYIVNFNGQKIFENSNFLRPLQSYGDKIIVRVQGESKVLLDLSGKILYKVDDKHSMYFINDKLLVVFVDQDGSFMKKGIYNYEEGKMIHDIELDRIFIENNNLYGEKNGQVISIQEPFTNE